MLLAVDAAASCCCSRRRSSLFSDWTAVSCASACASRACNAVMPASPTVEVLARAHAADAAAPATAVIRPGRAELNAADICLPSSRTVHLRTLMHRIAQLQATVLVLSFS